MSIDQVRDDKQALRNHRRDVARYWEHFRWVYLGVLAAATALAFVPALLEGFMQHGLGSLNWLGATFILIFCFVAANACYCVVYLLEFVVMGTSLQDPFHRNRTLLLVAGCALGALLAFGFAHEIVRELGVYGT